MQIETKIDLKQYRQLVLALTLRKPKVILYMALGIFMFGFGIYSCFYILIKEELLIFILGFFFILFYPVTGYIQAKKNFLSNARLQEKITYEFTEEKIKMSGESFTTEVTWEKTFKIMELKNWMLIFQNRITANVIPKEAFGNKLNEFRQLVRSKPFIKQDLKN